MNLTGRYILGAYKPRRNNNNEASIQPSSVEGLAVFNNSQMIEPISIHERNETFCPRGYAFIPPKYSKTVLELKDGDFIKCKILESRQQNEKDQYVIDPAFKQQAQH
jgi:hypothetical protein